MWDFIFEKAFTRVDSICLFAEFIKPPDIRQTISKVSLAVRALPCLSEHIRAPQMISLDPVGNAASLTVSMSQGGIFCDRGE
jgi:hypothetical protein